MTPEPLKNKKYGNISKDEGFEFKDVKSAIEWQQEFKPIYFKEGRTCMICRYEFGILFAKILYDIEDNKLICWNCLPKAAFPDIMEEENRNSVLFARMLKKLIV